MLGTFESQYMIALVAFMGAVAFVLFLGTYAVQSSHGKVSQRLRKLEGRDPSDGQSSLGALHDYMNASLAGYILPQQPQVATRFSDQLGYAGMYKRSALVGFFLARLLAITFPLVCLPLVVWSGTLNFQQAIAVCGVGSLIGFVLPTLWLRNCILERHQLLRNSMSDFLDLFVTCIESGVSLQSMISIVSEELKPAHPELSEEFQRCDRDMQLGATLEKSIDDLAARTNLEDLLAFSTFVRQSQKFGATLGSAMRELSDRLRSQRELRAEEAAQKASVKILLPTLIFIFPAVFMVLAAPAAITIYESFSNAGN
ncbi:type II secretion system F family protein [Aureliella helgolandensis]|uniref:Bacterial type II secretion system protein F domain protein n=1 Tax=Aureliella helgolandensis TaxID=2527968 RepID=A0A518G3X6_9BACT|nr:type II secretion system F family protein [Aureliella helgolandensis]QDV23301.1 Bacterial type II secretion system protein F domain protein [Aureliella helgolandensis]